MKKIIMMLDKINNNRYWEIGLSEKHVSSLDLMCEALRSFSIREVTDALLGKELQGCNNFVVEYEGDDFFVAFFDKMSFESSMKEISGYRFLDDDKIPKLKFSKENFDDVLKQWVKIKQENPQYLIITQDDSGWVGLQGKQELDDDEVALVDSYNRD